MCTSRVKYASHTNVTWLSHRNVVTHKPQPVIAIGDYMGSSYKG